MKRTTASGCPLHFFIPSSSDHAGKQSIKNVRHSPCTSNHIRISQSGNERFYSGVYHITAPRIIWWTLCLPFVRTVFQHRLRYVFLTESEQPTAKSVKCCSAASETKHKKPDCDGAQQQGSSCPYPFPCVHFYHGVLLLGENAFAFDFPMPGVLCVIVLKPLRCYLHLKQNIINTAKHVKS